MGGQNRKTHEEFVTEVKEIHGEKHIVKGMYINSNTPVEIYCNECKNSFFPRPSNYTKGNKSGCSHCGKVKRYKNKNSNFSNNFVKKLKKTGKNVIALSRYKKSAEKMTFKCTVCEEKFDAVPRNILVKGRGNGCPKCRSIKSKTVKNKKANDKFIDSLSKTNYKLLIGYVNAKTKVRLICEKHGEFETLPNSIINGSGCNKCGNESIGNKLTKPLDVFINEFEASDFKKEYILVGDYRNSKTKIKLKHKKCNKYWNVIPQNFLRGDRCPHCLNSKGENAIEKFLEIKNIPYNKQVKLSNTRKKYDFSINGLYMEYDGIQHFRPVNRFGGENEFKKVVKRDQIKNQYCIDNNIPLIRIPYWEFKNIEYILNSVLQHYELIPKEITYSDSWKKYLVDKNWNHDSYLALHK